MQLSLFEQEKKRFVLDKPVALIELFAGYGSQHLAFRYLGVPVRSFRICEWATPSIEAYNDIHIGDFTDYSEGKTKEELIDYLADKGISWDYSKPMDRKAIARKSEEWIRRTYSNIVATRDTVDIMRTHGSDFMMTTAERERVVMTYSFPCQDLSTAGQHKGMEEGSGTRSSMLWEVGRILKEMKQLGQLPDMLLMENVPTILGEKNIGGFNKWVDLLYSLGYDSYTKILSATGFGIPQSRRRCFVVSIPHGYTYEFPEEEPLKVTLRDMLEDEVDEKYFLSQDEITQITQWKSNQNPITKGLAMGGVMCQTVTVKSNTAHNYNMLLTSVDRRLKETIESNVLPEGVPQGIDLYNKSVRSTFPTLKMPNHNTYALWNGRRVRKLTPRECFRLMGVKDADSDKIKLSDHFKYHLAGDSIVVNVLEAIFKKALP